MKKIFLFIVLFALSFLTVGCIRSETTIEFVSTPKSVYTIDELEDSNFNFNQSVELRVNGLPSFTLANPPSGLIVSGLEGITTREPGDYTLTIKYKTATIYWSYKVIESLQSNVVEPDYDWYDDGTATVFEIDDIHDLYGFANIVNGKHGQNPDDFAGKTVKLTANIDLTSYIWTPIGEGVRKKAEKIITDQDSKEAALAALNTSTGGLYELIPDTDEPQKSIINDKFYLLKEGTKYTDKYYIFDNDGKFEVHKPIDTNYEESVFKGTFDGQNHTIKGLSDIGYSPQDISNYYPNSFRLVNGYVFGLFGRTAGQVTVKNLKMTDVAITGAFVEESKMKIHDLDSAGAIIGTFSDASANSSLLIENCEVSSGSINGFDSVGGLVGRLYYPKNATFKDVKNYAQVYSERKVGGIIGYTAAKPEFESNISFLNVVNYGQVSYGKPGSSSNGGGIISYMTGYKTATFTNCINYGNVIFFDPGTTKTPASTDGTSITHYAAFTSMGGILSNQYKAPNYDSNLKTKTIVNITNVHNYGDIIAVYAVDTRPVALLPADQLIFVHSTKVYGIPTARATN